MELRRPSCSWRKTPCKIKPVSCFSTGALYAITWYQLKQWHHSFCSRLDSLVVVWKHGMQSMHSIRGQFTLDRLRCQQLHGSLLPYPSCGQMGGHQLRHP